MPLLEEVRSACAEIAAYARFVRIDEDAAHALDPAPARVPVTLDPESHYLEGEPADVADYLLALDAINFGSGWFPTLRKRSEHGHTLSGYYTVAWALADHVRAHGPPTAGQARDDELMSLYAQALRALGRFLEGPPAGRALDVVAGCGGSAERLAEALAGRSALGGMAMFDDRGLYKRAQIVASDLALASIASFADLD